MRPSLLSCTSCPAHCKLSEVMVGIMGWWNQTLLALSCNFTHWASPAHYSELITFLHIQHCLSLHAILFTENFSKIITIARSVSLPLNFLKAFISELQ